MSAHTPLVQQQKLWKAFFIFLMPLIATNILQNLSGTINTIFVGQMMGVDAIAAVSVFFPILFFLLALLGCFLIRLNLLKPLIRILI